MYLFDTARGGQTRLTSEPTDDFSPAWSPHGDRLAFAGRRQGDRALNLYATNVSGTGGEKRLLDLDGVEIPTSWSPDERFLLFQTPSPGADINVLSLADGQVSSLVSTRFTEGSAQFSPDRPLGGLQLRRNRANGGVGVAVSKGGPARADLDRRRRVAAMAARRQGTNLHVTDAPTGRGTRPHHPPIRASLWRRRSSGAALHQDPSPDRPSRRKAS